MMEIKIEAATVTEIIHKAILDQLGDEGRTKLIGAALEYLLKQPESSSYNRYQQPSPLQQAFNEAAGVAARKIVLDQVANDPVFIAKVKQQVGEAMAKIDEINFSTHIAESLAEALRK